MYKPQHPNPVSSPTFQTACDTPTGWEVSTAMSRLVKKTSTVLSPVFGVRGRGRDLFVAVERRDLEAIVAKRLVDRYTPDTVWRKVRNGAYTQMEGRGELFHPPPSESCRSRARHSVASLLSCW